MGYIAPVTDMQFLLDTVLDAGRLAETTRFADATPEMAGAILTEAAKLSEEVLAPLNRAGDLDPAKLENGVVRTSKGFADGYRAIAEGGWVGMAADPDHGGMGLPMTLVSCVGEMMSSACLSLSLNPLMTQGQIEALEHHASPQMQALFLPRMIAGEWTGTMNLTEPQAGSDVGALRSKAEPLGDGTWAISGQKIYISWGDHDFGGNVCHLVLARTPGGKTGTKGISLFLVPKLIPDDNGEPGVANSLRVVSLEHKMGLHGSPTAVMEYDRATGWMVGEEFGGMAAMFTMMNNARLGVGVQGLSQAEAATQKALAYALDRQQGRSPVEGGTGSILDHADVRRMVLTMKALTATARAICLDTALSLDLGRALEGDAAKAQTARGAFLTPIAKAFGTDTGMAVSEMGVQVHGGMGFIEETGAAQYYRDVRVTAIYEGTNGIQAMDLVGRKLMDGGEAAQGLLAEIARTAQGAHGPLGDALAAAGQQLSAALNWMVTADMLARSAGATRFLRAFALTLGGHYLLKGAVASNDPDRLALARFHINHLLPEVEGLCRAACAGHDDLYALGADALAS